MSKYSRDFIRKSSGVGTWSSDKVKCVASMVFSSSRFTPSMSFEVIAKFLSDILSSGYLPLLSKSRSSNQEPVYGLVFSLTPLFKLHHSLRPLYTREETIEQDVEYLASAVSFISPFRQTQFRAVPSRLLVNALHSCFFEKLSSSKCNFITSIQVSMQPSDSSLYECSFLFICLARALSWGGTLLPKTPV